MSSLTEETGQAILAELRAMTAEQRRTRLMMARTMAMLMTQDVPVTQAEMDAQPPLESRLMLLDGDQ